MDSRVTGYFIQARATKQVTTTHHHTIRERIPKTKAVRLILLQGKPINPGGASVGPCVVLQHGSNVPELVVLSVYPVFLGAIFVLHPS